MKSILRCLGYMLAYIASAQHPEISFIYFRMLSASLSSIDDKEASRKKNGLYLISRWRPLKYIISRWRPLNRFFSATNSVLIIRLLI